jgi:hypothetical protein
MKYILALVLCFPIACAPLAAIENADDAQFSTIQRRARALTDYTSARLVREGRLTCEQANKIADRIEQIAAQLGDVSQPQGITAEFLESLGLLPEDVELVAFVVGEIKAELGLDRVELVGPRVRALLVTIAEAARCN